MLKSEQKIIFNNGWSFATINKRLAEITFSKEWGLYGYCYVDRSEYSKSEQKQITADVEKFQFSLRNGIFRDKINNITFPLGKVIIDEKDLVQYKNKSSFDG